MFLVVDFAFERNYNALLKSYEWTLNRTEGHVLLPDSDVIEKLAFSKPSEELN